MATENTSDSYFVLTPKATTGGQYWFALKAANGQVLMRSENYMSRDAARNAIEKVKAMAVDAKVVEI